MATVDIKRPYGTKNDWTWETVDDCMNVHEDIDQGVTDHRLCEVAIGLFPSDLHIDQVSVTLENAPGAGKSVAVSATNGVSTITATVADTDTSASSTTNNFDWDASAQPLTISYTSTAGATQGHGSIRVDYHRILIT